MLPGTPDYQGMMARSGSTRISIRLAVGYGLLCKRSSAVCFSCVFVSCLLLLQGEICEVRLCIVILYGNIWGNLTTITVHGAWQDIMTYTIPVHYEYYPSLIMPMPMASTGRLEHYPPSEQPCSSPQVGPISKSVLITKSSFPRICKTMVSPSIPNSSLCPQAIVLSPTPASI